MRSLRLLGLLGAVAVLAATGCSQAPADRAPTEAEEAIIDRMAETPGEETDPADTEAARNEMVTACMAEENLDYLGPAEALSLIEWLGTTPEEFGERYGFGHTTTVDVGRAHRDFVDATLSAHRASLEALSPGERAQYEEIELDCLQESYAELGFPVSGSIYLPNDSPIHEYFDQATAATAEDPRLAEVTRAWSQCMAEQGYDFENRDDMGLPLQEAAQPFIESYESRALALIDAGQTWEDLHVADVLDAEQLAALEELQQRELAAWAAHQQCIGQGHDIDAVYSEIYNEHLAELTGS